jgi:carbamoyl-phosphate synthase large subunit
LKNLKVIITASGCPGASTFIKMLKNNGERKMEIIGVDMDDQAIGKFITDKFYQVPAGNTTEFIETMLDITKIEKPDIIFPESSNEVYNLACNKARFEQLGTKVIVSSPESIQLANDKYQMYEVLKQNSKLELPSYHLANNMEQFLKAISDLGYPDKPVIFKPPVGKGSRGVRILDPAINRMNMLLNEKPTSKYMSLEEFKQIFSDDSTFPSLLVMEYLQGREYTTDAIALNGEALLTTVKTVEQARWGVIVKGELVNKPDLVEQTKEILKYIPLSYCVNIQFIGSKLIEINPRVSSFIYQDDLIPPYISIKLALKETKKEDVVKLEQKIDYGRRMVRYMDQVFYK